MLRHLLVFVSVVLASVSAFGQFGGGGNQGGGPGGGVGGIRIDASGVVQQARIKSASARELHAELLEVAKTLPADINTVSPLRKVSLAKLDRELSRLLAEGADVPPEMRYLGGLTSISTISIAPDGSDIILAGPAEGFAPGRDGRVVGIDSGRPILCLDDLLVALRHVDDRSIVGCSFDPDPQRLVQTREALQRDTFASSKADAQRQFEATAELMGNWNVRVLGVPDDSRLAVALVEADFLLKRLTTGAERTGIRGFKSYLAAMKPTDDALKRWWFSPLPDILERSEDGRLFRLSGQRLQVSAQDEVVDAQGNRTDAEVTAENLSEYAQEFTRRLPDVARKYAAVAHLQNLVDILVTTAVIRSSQSAGILTWQPQALLDGERLPTERFVVPRETPSIATVRSAGSRTIIGLIAGGVIISPDRLLAAANPATLQPLESTTSDRWWWD